MDNEEVMWSHPADVMWFRCVGIELLGQLKIKTDNHFIF